MSTFVLPLADPAATLDTVGGKGMSLAKMAQAGLPVPGGFYVTTAAYRRFVAENELQPRILAALAGADPDDPAGLERISQQIGQFFTEGAVPADIAGEICAAYEAQGEKPVAVRSSATAEDLPGASFAGQQETYLNMIGEEAVLSAVKKCWASLWTARAVAYRSRQGIPPDEVALAVVVQELIFAEAAGVLFTANPVNGSQEEMMITAAWGLGEAIVGGLVTPDTLIVDRNVGKVTRRETSEKQVMTVRDASGTREQPVPGHLRMQPVLSDAQAAELARLGETIERLYGMPMDIEWTLAGGQFAVVQARPVTTMGAAPVEETHLTWTRSNPKAVLARGSFGEFVPDPVSPLFATLAVPIAESESQKMMAGIYGPNDVESYLFEVINGYVYVGMVLTPKMIWKAVVGSLGQTVSMMKTAKRRWAAAQVMLREAAEKWQRDLTTLPASALLAGTREVFRATAEYYTIGQTGAIPMAPMSELVFSRFYKALVKRKPDPDPSIFFLGFDTIPLRAEKSLYDLSLWAKSQPALAEAIQGAPADEICAALRKDPIPAPYVGSFAERFAAHLAAYGHTLYDLDFAKPVPADDPKPLIEAMKAYLEGRGTSPYERQQKQVARREQAEQAILSRLDPLRRKLFTKLLRWSQSCSPDREDCIADLGLGYPQLRRLVGELGRRLAAGGAVDQPEDVYWLEAAEADSLARALDSGDRLTSYQEQISQRKAIWRRARKASPPVTIPEKSWMGKMLAHENPEGSQLKGYAASPGKVTARACVLQGPEEFANMRPGDIIVAVTTTPAWTPLFAIASGVVTDIGGPLSHSSIVAREYGIPAVMATGVASRRIQNGQTITVDGTAGTVKIQAQP